MPWVVWGFFKLITPFIDPRTVHKLKFNEDMTQYVAPDQLWPEYQEQGTLPFEYDHAEYWPALDKLGAEIRAERKARWVAGGKHVGELEDYICGGVEVGVAAELGADGEEKTTEANGEETKPEELKIGELSVEEKKGEEVKASA